ncbi:MAG: hypothetical protein Q3963_04395 [Coriobacteriaceae bacterium]|nr:hypothetical protein [Coriobacteriaceae bacterium]
MAKLRAVLPQAVRAMGGSVEDVAKQARAAEVQRMWEHIMRKGGDEYILAHTNNVFILREGDARALRRDHDDRKDAGATGTGKQLVAYVDESIVAAELNARRELVKLQFFEEFGERIDEFKIIISRGQYKAHHPFVKQEATPSYIDDVRPVPLSPEERAVVDQQVAGIEDARLRRAVERAMVADLEWKKALGD